MNPDDRMRCLPTLAVAGGSLEYVMCKTGFYNAGDPHPGLAFDVDLARDHGIFKKEFRFQPGS